MIRIDTVPEATAPPEHHADFLELCTLRSGAGSTSIQEFIRDLRIGNATEVVADSEDRDEDYESDDEDEAIAQTAFDELDERRRNFGLHAKSYPFELSETSISLKENGDESLYTFLALLSWCGKDAGPKGTDGERIFEEICAKAAESYLGHHDDGRVRSVVFGFPRRILPAGFSAALDELCKQLGEGGSHRKGRSKLPNQKDGKLDVVAWVEFQDRRQGKLITFGQCAEVLTLSGTGKTLILSVQKDKEDGSEEDCIEVKRHTSSLHGRVQGGSGSDAFGWSHRTVGDDTSGASERQSALSLEAGTIDSERPCRQFAGRACA